MSKRESRNRKFVQGSSRLDKEDAQERFFATLKDMIELLKTWTLGAALFGAGMALVTSNFPVFIRILGALASITMGMMVVVSSVLIFSRYRLQIVNVTAGKKIESIMRFVFLMGVGVSVCVLTLELIKQRIADRRAEFGVLPTEACGKLTPTQRF